MLHSQITGVSDKIIIFIHGNSQSLLTWDLVISSSLLDGFKKITIDLPGHGKSFYSDQPEVDYSIKGLAANTLNFLKHYTDNEYILVGTSLGTNIIGELNPIPTNCKGIFLTAATLSASNLTVAEMLIPNPALGAGFSPDPSEEEIDDLINNVVHIAANSVKSELKAAFKKTDPNLRVHLGQSIANQEWADEVANVLAANIPVAIVYGKEDKLVQTDYLERTNLIKWQDKIIKIDNSGHCTQLDQPEVLADLIRKFAGDCFK